MGYNKSDKYVVYDGRTYSNNIDELLKLINSSHYYRVYTKNAKESDNYESDAGYYYTTGYIKTILIEDVSKK